MKICTPIWVRSLAMEEAGGAGDGAEHAEQDTNGDEPEDSSAVEDSQEESQPSLAELASENEQLRKQLDEWRKHSRDWESKSKENLKNVERLTKQLEESASAEVLAETQQRLDAAQEEAAAALQQVQLLTTLVNLGADVAPLIDSRSFMEQAEALDVNDKDFINDVRSLVQSHKVRSPGRQLFIEQPAEKCGADLWTLVHGRSDT